jgi:hypothetical protein
MKKNGSLWKLGDNLRDKGAVKYEGFSFLTNEKGKVISAYKLVI